MSCAITGNRIKVVETGLLCLPLSPLRIRAVNNKKTTDRDIMTLGGKAPTGEGKGLDGLTCMAFGQDTSRSVMNPAATRPSAAALT